MSNICNLYNKSAKVCKPQVGDGISLKVLVSQVFQPFRADIIHANNFYIFRGPVISPLNIYSKNICHIILDDELLRYTQKKM